MQWLVGGGQLLVGIALLVTWWLALSFLGRNKKPLTAFRFVGLPSIFLLWFVGGAILVFHGVGLI